MKCRSNYMENERSIPLHPPLAYAFGDKAALILQQIRYWMQIREQEERTLPPSKRVHFKEGRWWVYNTYENWQRANFGFWSQKTIERQIRKLEGLGVLISEQFGQPDGNNTKWYSIDFDTMDRLVEASEQQRRFSLDTPPGQNVLKGGPGQIVQDKKSRSIYKDSQIDLSDDDQEDPDQTTHQTNSSNPSAPWTAEEAAVIEREWARLGLSGELKRGLRRIQARQALGLVYHAKAEGTRNRAGLLRVMLVRGDDPLPKYLDQAERQLVPEAQHPTEVQLGPSPKRKPLPVGLDEKPNGSLTVRDIWNATLGQLQVQLNRATFDTYLAGSEPTRFEGGTLWLRSRHAYASQWFEPRRAMIEHITSGIAGTAIAVRIENAEGADQCMALISPSKGEKEYSTK